MRNEAYPKPASVRGNVGLRALRGPGTIRQPDLKAPPSVSAITGFGSAAGAGIHNNGADADQSQGLVAIRTGLAPAGTGTIALSFASAPALGQYWIAADWATFTQAVAGNILTLTWTATRSLNANERLRIAYQWSQSQ